MKWERMHSACWAGGGGWKVDISTVCGGVASLSYIKVVDWMTLLDVFMAETVCVAAGPPRPGPAALEMTDKLR